MMTPAFLILKSVKMPAHIDFLRKSFKFALHGRVNKIGNNKNSASKFQVRASGQVYNINAVQLFYKSRFTTCTFWYSSCLPLVEFNSGFVQAISFLHLAHSGPVHPHQSASSQSQLKSAMFWIYAKNLKQWRGARNIITFNVLSL